MQRIHLRRRRLATLAAVAALAFSALFATTTEFPAGASADAASTSASGVSPATLTRAGWDCLFVVHAVHCLRPGAFDAIGAGTAVTFSVLVFDTEDPTSTNAPLLGTEFNIRADHFHGQPCPTDPPSRQYTYLPTIGVPIDFYACHRFDSPL
jgi:hypothetical protein